MVILSDLEEVMRRFREFEEYVKSLGLGLAIDLDESDLDLEEHGEYIMTLAANLPDTDI